MKPELIWRNTMNHEYQKKHEKLDALDSKTGSLLQVTSLMMILVTLPELKSRLNWSYNLSMGLFVTAVLFSLTILWFNKKPSDSFVRRRVLMLNISVILVASGVLITVIDILL